MKLLRFYFRLLKRTPEVFRGAWETVFFVIGVVFFVVTAFNKQLGQKLSQQWDGISPWWTLLVVGAFVGIRMAINIHETFIDLEKRTVGDEQRMAQRREIREGLTRLIAEAKFSENKCLNLEDTAGLSQQAESFRTNARQFLKTGFEGDESYWNLFIGATEHDCELTPNERIRLTHQNARWVKLLRAQRTVLEKCLAHYPPL